MYINKAKDRLAELHMLQKLKLIGCRQEDIQRVEEKIGASLPLAYQEFLVWMGRVSQLFQGSDYSCLDILNLQPVATDLLEENHEREVLPTDAFVFLMHQGYQFNFFRLSEGDDPPVYWYIEGQGYFKKTFDHFSEFLLDVVNGYAQLRQQTNARIKATAQKNPKTAERLTELAKALDMYDDQAPEK